jgi:hypothetical protein
MLALIGRLVPSAVSTWMAFRPPPVELPPSRKALIDRRLKRWVENQFRTVSDRSLVKAASCQPRTTSETNPTSGPMAIKATGAPCAKPSAAKTTRKSASARQYVEK